MARMNNLSKILIKLYSGHMRHYTTYVSIKQPYGTTSAVKKKNEEETVEGNGYSM